MKKFIAMILGVVLFVGSTLCAYAETTFKKESVKIDENRAYGIISAYEGKNLLWEYRTLVGRVAEFENISEVYRNGDIAYFAAGGTLYALDMASGALKWTHKGVSTADCFCFDKYGNVYVSAYYGPNVVVVDKSGNRLYIDNDGSYCWVDSLEIVGNTLNIHYGLDDLGNDDGVRTLDIEQFNPQNLPQNQIKVTIDGEFVEFDQPPVSVDGRTLVPIRAVMEKMGGEVNWLGETSTTEIKMDDKKMLLILGSKTAFFDGDVYNLDVEPQSINNRTVLPLRFVAEKFGFDVYWDGDTNTVVIER